MSNNPHEHGVTYPVQSSEHTPHVNQSLSGTEDKKHPLPEAIRAVTDASKTESHGRTVVICLDGTGDQFDGDNSNVVHFVSCLKKHDPSKQVTYYQSGIGTYDAGGLRNGIGAAVDMAVGSGLGIHVKDAYRFLMQNYREGDKICLLGFSRGAYTVRCLAGMLHKVGLLPASNGAQVNFAYGFYKDDSEEGWKMSAQFKKTFCTNVDVYFVGVWDCVASVGFVPRKLPFSKSPTNSIHYFRHAMALDEHRAKFKVCHWQHQNPDIQRRDTLDNTPAAQVKRGLFNCFGGKKSKDGKSTQNGTASNGTQLNGNGIVAGPKRRRTLTDNESVDQQEMETEFEKLDLTRGTRPKINTDALEVWFMGCHADVGGGAVANEERHMLSRIPLRWMLRQCFSCNTGILFSVAALAEQGLDVRTLYPVYHAPSIPAVGPSPHLVEKFEEGALPPLHRRSTALGCADDRAAITTAHAHEDRTKRSNDDPTPANGFRQDAHEQIPGTDPAPTALDLLPEHVEDHFDSMAPVNDQLVDARGWWVLEAWPVKVRVQMKNSDEWEKKVRMNMGRYRAVRQTDPKMHWTVQRRVDEGGYKVRTRVDRRADWEIVS